MLVFERARWRAGVRSARCRPMCHSADAAVRCAGNRKRWKPLGRSGNHSVGSVRIWGVTPVISALSPLLCPLLLSSVRPVIGDARDLRRRSPPPSPAAVAAALPGDLRDPSPTAAQAPFLLYSTLFVTGVDTGDPWPRKPPALPHWRNQLQAKGVKQCGSVEHTSQLHDHRPGMRKVAGESPRGRRGENERPPRVAAGSTCRAVGGGSHDRGERARGRRRDHDRPSGRVAQLPRSASAAAGRGRGLRGSRRWVA